MAKAKLLKSFVHDGKTYNIGDEFDGTDAEIADLVRQGYMKHEDKEPPEPQPVDTGTGKGTDVSDSSSSSTGDSYSKYQKHAAQPERPTHK